MVIIQTGVELKSPPKQLGVYSRAQFCLNCRKREKRNRVLNPGPGGLVVKNPPSDATDARDPGLILTWVRKVPWSKKWQPALLF